MAIDIISLVERSQTDEVTGELVGPGHEATQGEAKVEGTKSGKEEGSDEHHIYESLPRNTDK